MAGADIEAAPPKIASRRVKFRMLSDRPDRSGTEFDSLYS